MIDEFKKQLAAISGQDIGDIKFYSKEEVVPQIEKYNQAWKVKSNDRYDLGNALEKYGKAGDDFDVLKDRPHYIKDLHRSFPDGVDHKNGGARILGNKSNQAINLEFGEGDYPFYYKGKDSTLVGRIKGNQVIDVRTFHANQSLLTIQEFAKGRKGDAYRLEMGGKGIYNLSADAREGYDFLNFQIPTGAQIESSKDGFRFGTSSLEEMEAALRDRSSLEAMNYLGVELNAYEKTGPMLRGNGQVTFKPEQSTKVGLASNNALREKLMGVKDPTSSSTLASNQSINTSKVNKVVTSDLGSASLASNKSLSQSIGRILKKVF